MADYIVKNKDELYHHGIKGQRWGVRRYQNYDGSYTQTGVKRYKKSAEKLQEAKKNYKSAKASGDKLATSRAKEELRRAKINEKGNYKQLKQDYKADKGKMLYQQGKTIEGNNNKSTMATTALSGAGTLGAYGAKQALVGKNVVLNNRSYPAGNVAGASILAGSAAVTGLYNLKLQRENSYLRAYYGHSRRKDI